MRELARTTDTRLAEVHATIEHLGHEIRAQKSLLRTAHGQYTVYRSSSKGEWSGTWEEVELSRRTTTSPALWDRLDTLVAQNNEALAEMRTLNQTYRQHYWSRFYLAVTSSDGHIHSSVDCHSCYPSTRFAWLPELSGASEAEAVAEEGEILCSFCFPSAPTNWTEGVGRRTREAQEARQREKDERQAAKIAKSLSLDGNTVTIRATNPQAMSNWKDFKTYRAAELWAVQALAYAKTVLVLGREVYGAPDAYTPENLELVLQMMSEKSGKTLEQLVSETAKRVAKKVEEEVRWHRS